MRLFGLGILKDSKRQEHVFGRVAQILEKEFSFDKKDFARKAFYELRQMFIDLNYKKWDSKEFKDQEVKIDAFINKGDDA